MLAKVGQVFPPVAAVRRGPAGNVAGFVEDIDRIGLFAAAAVVEGRFVGIVETQERGPPLCQVFEGGEVLLGLFAFLFADALGRGPDGIDDDRHQTARRERPPRPSHR